MKKISRIDVYRAIDGERDYQDAKWGDLNNRLDGINNPSSFILWMEEYLSYARKLASTTNERVGTKTCGEIMDAIRKVTALGVACMEFNGAPNRKE